MKLSKKGALVFGVGLVLIGAEMLIGQYPKVQETAKFEVWHPASKIENVTSTPEVFGYYDYVFKDNKEEYV